MENAATCQWDAVEVYDGETGGLLGRYCGDSMPEVVGSGTSLRVSADRLV